MVFACSAFHTRVLPLPTIAGFEPVPVCSGHQLQSRTEHFVDDIALFRFRDPGWRREGSDCSVPAQDSHVRQS